MKTGYIITLIASIALVSMVFGASLAGAETTPSSPAPAETKAEGAQAKAPMPACPMCPMMAGEGKGMCKEMDMPPAKKQCCKMMMNTEMSKNDAACLLALKEELKLTPEQAQKLEQIIKESRQQSAAVLTPEQQKTLADVAGEPTSMMGMHKEMHDKMMKKMESDNKKVTEEKAKKEAEEKVKKEAESADSPKK